METKVCTICTLPLENEDDSIVTVKQDGLKTLIKMSIAKNDDKHLAWKGKQSFQFHEACRSRYLSSNGTNSSQAKKSSEDPPLASPSTNQNPFNFIENCFFCGEKWHDLRSRTGEMSKNYKIERILTTANLRNDEIGRQVIQRLNGIDSLFEVEARYHKQCYKDFFIIPDPNKPIRKNPREIEKIIDKVCKYMEESNESQFQLSTLQKIMGEDKLSNEKLFRRLEKRYGDDIFISLHRGKTIIYYRHKLRVRRRENAFGDPENLENQRNKYLRTAAKILRSEITAQNYDNDFHRKSGDFFDSVEEDIPDLLNYFLSDLILTKEQRDDHSSNFVKRDNIAHAIISSVRPRSFYSHLQHAVGTYIHKKTGRRWIIDLLSKLGISITYGYLQPSERAKDSPEMHAEEDAFLRYMFGSTDDNVDGNSGGKRTFDCLGGGETLGGPAKKCKTVDAFDENTSDSDDDVL